MTLAASVPLPESDVSDLVRGFLIDLAAELDADPRRAMYQHRLFPGARVRDRDGRSLPGLDGATWARRAILYGPREPLTLVSRHGRALGGLDPTPSGWVAWVTPSLRASPA